MKTCHNRYLCVMLRITSHIERLLALHDCVLIPHWGGFVLQTVPAGIRKEEHAFTPMRKEVVFNAALQHTDGLLAMSYMQAYEVEFRLAQQMIDSDVEEMKASLARYGKLAFGSIGSFTTGKAGQTVFHPGNTPVFDAGFYGLETFHFPVLPAAIPQALPGSAVSPKADIFYIPVNRRLVRGVIASAAAVALFLLISTPVKEVNISAYTASFIPTERVIQATDTGQAAGSATDEATDITLPEATEEALPVTAGTPETTGQTTPVNTKKYYIVIASFPAETLANVFIAGVSQEEFGHLSTVMRDGQYRVYSDVFDNRETAEAQLATVRRNAKYDSAWLFIAR